MNYSLEALEYGRVKELLGRYASTSAALELLDQMVPFEDRERLNEEHAITAEAMQYLREQRVPFHDIPLLPSVIDKLTLAGSVLEIPEVEAIQAFLSHVEALRVRWNNDREHFPKLRNAAQRLPDLRELAKHLGRAVQNGEIDEAYSPALRRIRRAISAAKTRLTEKLESIIRSPAYSSQLQEQLVTIRNGRFVIPVRSEQKRTVDGIVHGTSSSGATVFMEPLVVVEINNDLVRLEDEERAEIARILAELTDLIQTSAAPIRSAVTVSAYLEVTFAKGRFGREFNCARPEFSEDAVLRLVHARHPLLEEHLRREDASMIPASLDLDSERRILVISGPNAGGKTIVLKTAGLLALMAQSGIPVPAEQAVLPIFDRVLADIGDRQSIANHLSTFSAHVLTLKSMLESATSRSLILLDEIGSSTEPGEGAALARAVLEQFREMHAFVIATTHYNRLKLYAETTPGAVNAAMEFDELTLAPTYRLIHGLSGASSGLKIAERLQLPRPVLNSAAGFLDAAEVEAARYADDLRQRMVRLERQKAELEAERQAFEAWKQKDREAFHARQNEAIAQAGKRLDAIFREAADRAERELETARDESFRKLQKKLAGAKAHASRELDHEKELAQSASQAPPNPSTTAAPEIREGRPIQAVEGQMVRVKSLAITGRIAAIQGDQAEVLAGNMKLRRPLSDLEALRTGPMNLPQNVHVHFAPKELERTEIKLIGRTTDEAVQMADKFLDDAFLAQISVVRIVHGLGTGALRQAISDMLSRHPLVSGFEPAPQAEGGRGVTVVTLRE